MFIGGIASNHLKIHKQMKTKLVIVAILCIGSYTVSAQKIIVRKMGILRLQQWLMANLPKPKAINLPYISIMKFKWLMVSLNLIH